MACLCRPYFNTMELWTLDPKLHLSSQDTTFCLITCLLAPPCAQHVCLPPFDPFVSMFFACFLSSLLLSWLVRWLVSVFLACTRMEQRMLRARARPPRCKQKGQRRKHEGTSPKRAIFSRLEAQPPGAVISFYPLLLASSLEHCIRFILHVPFLGCIPRIWQCLICLSCTLLGHILRMQACIFYLSCTLLWVVFLGWCNV